ncbi:MAG: PilW family protein [Pseudomonadota bacterium]
MKTQRERGLSLVELMVALTIGLFLLLGLGTMFSAMRQTSNARNGLSALQDSERMAMVFLGSAVQGAGSFPIGSSPNFNTAILEFPVAAASPPDPSYIAGQSIRGTTGATPGTDILSVRFRSNPAATGVGAIQGCSSSITANNVLYTNTFRVSNGNLVCTQNGTDTPMVSGVAGMTVLYGVDPGNTGSVTAYVTASSVTNWSAVKTVNITLQFTNPLAGQPGQPATVNFSRTIAVMSAI